MSRDEYQKQYYIKNKERINTYSNDSYHADREEILKYLKKKRAAIKKGMINNV